MTALAELREAPGLEAYLAELEDSLDHAVGTYRGIVSEVGGEADRFLGRDRHAAPQPRRREISEANAGGIAVRLLG